MGVLSLSLLGGFTARVGTRPIMFSSRKARALVAYLSLSPGKSHHRETLAAVLWAESAAVQARNSLRQCLFGIRRTLARHRTPILLIDGESVALGAAAVEVDVATFELLIARGMTEDLERATALYKGPFLEGLSLSEGPFEDWLMAERQRLGDLALGALTRLVDRYAEAGAVEPAIQTGLRLLALDPLQETMHRVLMRLRAQRGQRGAALRQYQACADILRRELGVEPEAETQRLYRKILKGPALVAPAPSERTLITDLAESAREARGRSAAPLVGRDAELAVLRREVALTRQGNGRVVTVLGEAGIGKSRLVEEIEDAALADGWRLIAARSHESEQMLALGVWANALREAGIHERLAAVSGLALAWQHELVRLLPELAPTGARSSRSSGSERLLFEAVAGLLAHLAATRPLLVVLEDLHWADEASLRLAAFVARRLESHPILAIATARSEEFDDSPTLRCLLGELRREQRVTEIFLLPLARPSTTDLVRALTTRRIPGTDVGALSEQVWLLSEGNPFIAVETVRACQEGAGFASSRALALPARARAMLLGRVERLGEGSRHLLEVAAVIGRDFEFSLLWRASTTDERAAAAGLEELVRRRLVHGLGERFDFTHDRIWEVVYEQLSPVRRRLLHAAVAHAIERLHTHDLTSHHAALGVHWAKGQIWDRAVVHLRAAGTQAAMRGAYWQAVALFEQALDALDRLPEDSDMLAQAIDLRIELRDWLLPLGELDRLAGYARQAQMLAARLGDDRRLAVVCGHLAHYHWLMGEQERAIEYANHTLAIGQHRSDESLVTTANFYLGEAYHARGDYRRTVEVLRENAGLRGERMVERLAGPGLVPVMSRVWFAFALAELGRFPEAIDVLEEALPTVEALEHPYSLMRIHVGLGVVHLTQGHLERALPALERALVLVDRWDIALDRPGVGAALGLAYVMAGRSDQGLPLLERSVERFLSSRASSSLSRRLGEGYLLAGRLDDALTWGGKAIDHARRYGARADEAWALHLLAEIAASAPELDRNRAVALYADARIRGNRLEMQPLVARCHLGLGRLYARVGNESAAATELQRAIELMQTIDLGRWRSQAEGALASLGESAAGFKRGRGVPR